MDARTYPAKETPKSRRTRARILDAAMRLFAEVGYHAATNAMIADAANLTRGAMLYHFASREELVEAAVAYIEVERARLFEQAASPPGPGVDAAEHAIDAYWSLLHEIPFVAFAELEAAARTDQMLRERLAGAAPRSQTGRDFGGFRLEGLARGALMFAGAARRDRLLTVVKRAVRVLNRKGDVQELWPE